jgi:hypothetical protein
MKKIQAEWWRPTDMDKKWYGDVEIIPHKSFRYEFYNNPDDIVNGDTIWGITKCNIPITLLKCNKYNSVAYVVDGIHVNFDDKFIHILEFEVENFIGWFGVDTPPIKISISDEVEFKLKVCSNLNSSSTLKSFESVGIISITFKNGIALSESWDYIDIFKELIYLATLKKSDIKQISIYNCKLYTICNDTIHYTPVIIYTSNTHNVCDKKFHAPDFTFQYNDISDFNALIKTWMIYRSTYKEFLEVYSHVIYHTLTPWIKLLTLTQSIEAYYLKTDKYPKTKRNAKGKDVDVTLEDKIKNIITDKKEILSRWKRVPPDFSEVVIDTRDYLTHHLPKFLPSGKRNSGQPNERVGKSVSEDIDELMKLNETLVAIIQVLIIQDIIPNITNDKLNFISDQFAVEYLKLI